MDCGDTGLHKDVWRSDMTTSPDPMEPAYAVKDTVR